MTASALAESARAQTPLSAALRASTRALHDEAEAALPLMQAFLTGEIYLQHLQSLWPVVRTTEQALAPWHERLLPLVGDRVALEARAPLLRADVGVLAPDTLLAPGPVSRPSPSLPHAVGSWYVLAGARLGGQVIAQRVARVLGLQGSAGLAYYGACTRRDGARFRAFLRAIDSCKELEQCHQQVLQGAHETFVRYCRALLPSSSK